MKRLTPGATPLACCVLLIAACNDEGVREATARVEVDARASFGAVFAGATAEASFRILSTGTAPVRVASVATRAPGLEIVSSPQGLLDGGSSRVVTLRWRPEAPGQLDASVEVGIETDELRAFTVAVTGEATAVPSCDDGNPCTDGVFDAAAGHCVFTLREGACDDGNACTQGDRCAQGVCVGVAMACNDDDPCTRDLCEPATGCVFLPDEAVCDDGDPCTRDVCEGIGVCSHPPVPDYTVCGLMTCAALNVCVGGHCRTLDVTGASNGRACDDGDRCTTEDQCRDGECVGAYTPRGPELLREVPVVGGSEARVGTDGLHLLVHDQGLLHVATRQAQGPFRFRSTTEVAMSTAPIALSPGRFVAADREALLFIDVTRPATPVVTRRPLEAEKRILRMRPAAGGLMVHRVSHEEELVHVALDEAGVPGAETTLLSEWVMDFDVAGNQLVYAGKGGTWWALVGGTAGARPRLTRLTHLSSRFARVATDGDRIALNDGHLTVGRLAQVPVDDPVACDGQGPCRGLGPSCDRPDAFEAGPWRLCDLDGSCPTGASCQERVVDLCPDCEDCASNETTVWLCVTMHRTVFQPIFEAASPDPFPVATDVALVPGGGAWVGGTVAGARRYSADGTLEATVLPHNPSVEVVGRLVLLSGGERLGVLEQRDEGYVDVAPEGLGAFRQVVPSTAGKALLGGTHAVAELDLEEGRLSSWHSTLSDGFPACRQLLSGAGGYAMAVDEGPGRPPVCEVARLDAFDAAGEAALLRPEEYGEKATFVTGNLLWQRGDWLKIWRLDDFKPLPFDTMFVLSEEFTSVSGDDLGERLLALRSVGDEPTVARILDPPWHFPNTSMTFTLEGAPPGLEGPRLAGGAVLGSAGRALLLWGLGEPQLAARLELDQWVNGSPRWMSPTRAWVTLRDDHQHFVAEVGHDSSAGHLRWLGQLTVPGEPRAIRPVHDAVVVVHDRGASVIAPACE